MNGTISTYRQTFLHYSHLASLICCLFFNGLLCLCLYVEKRRQLRIYRSVLFIQCFADMLASVIYYYTSMTFVIVDGIFYVVMTDQREYYQNILGFEIHTGCWIVYWYLYALYLGLLFVPLNFYYRYQQLCQ